MPRANRYFLGGYVWHLTHRCHGSRHLLGFARDRRRWVTWLVEARRRYGLTVLNYAVTCNHVHLLVFADGDGSAVPLAMQLIAGRTAQEYNARRGRHGAFWEDRYHATAVETGKHLRRCMTYIDLNMVRAGVVRHPDEWEFGGYREIQHPRERYRRIDTAALLQLLELGSLGELQAWQRESVLERLGCEGGLERRPEWTESIAVGGDSYVARVQAELGIAARHRSALAVVDGTTALWEEPGAYRGGIDPGMGPVRPQNAIPWITSD